MTLKLTETLKYNDKKTLVTSPGGSISEHGGVNSVQHALDDVLGRLLKDIALSRRFIKDTIKGKS